MSKEIESRLRHFAHEAAMRRRSPAASKAAVAAIKHFQRDRLARANADLLQSERYRLAARFFLDELYGVKDFTSRDQELARIIPSMSRLLPAAALGALADAIELDAISERLDEEMAALHEAGADGPAGAALPELTEARYFDLYRAVGRRELRVRQIELVEDVGRQLDKLVGKPFLLRILKTMEGPARLAGLAQMQSFLVDGFLAFRNMRGSEEFVRTVVTRERAVMDAAFAGAGSAGAEGPGPAGRGPAGTVPGPGK
jgi:hypothetical protein